MKTFSIQQGSEEWIGCRLGLPTASNFGNLITQKTFKPSASRIPYMHRKLAEIFTGEPQDGTPATPAMIRGSELEPEAADWYAFAYDTEVQTVGFVTTDDGRVGGSPDRLIGNDGGLEVKCPEAKGMIGYLLGTKEHEHRCQVQGYLWLTGRAWWDLLIYHPTMGQVVSRHEPDPEWVEAFEAVLSSWLTDFDAARESLISRGLSVVEADTVETISIACAECGEEMVITESKQRAFGSPVMCHYFGRKVRGMAVNGRDLCNGCVPLEVLL